MILLGRKLPSPLSPKLLLPLFHHLKIPSPPLNPNNNNSSSSSKPYSSQSQSPPPLPHLRHGCHPDDVVDSDASPATTSCPGCGVHMQSSDPTLPGFFSSPSPKPPDYRAPLLRSSALPLSGLPLSLKSGHLHLPPADQDQETAPEASRPVVCARCHSLRHYGRVKNPSAENLLPDFDFDRSVAPKMLSPSGPRSTVLLIVDASDFEGSFPKRLAKLLAAAIDSNSMAWKEGKPANVPRVLLVVTKCDVLPSSLSPERLEEWARRRAHECGGSMRLAGVHLVSSVKDWGVRNLVEHVVGLAGSRGNVWVVGAQNAGKSTLINAMGRCVAGGRKAAGQLTEAPVPGTTIGIVRVDGVLSGQAKMFDTPGILNPCQVSTRLTREEQKLVHVAKELRPRTYRIKVSFPKICCNSIRTIRFKLTEP